MILAADQIPPDQAISHWVEHHGMEVLIIAILVGAAIWGWNKVAPKIIPDLKKVGDYVADHGMQILTVVLLIVAIHMVYSRVLPPDAGWATIGGSLMPWIYALRKRKTGEIADANHAQNVQTLQGQNETLDWQNIVLQKLVDHVGQISGKPVNVPQAPGSIATQTSSQAPPPGSPASQETQGGPKVMIGGPPKQFT